MAGGPRKADDVVMALASRVDKLTTHAVVTSSDTSTQFGRMATFWARVSALRSMPTGAVQFRLDGMALGEPVRLDQLGRAATCTAILPCGAHVITAAYLGDEHHARSTATVEHEVQPAVTAVHASPLIASLFRPHVRVRRADTGVPLSGRQVTFSVGGRDVCTAVSDVNGIAECSEKLLVSIGRYSATVAPAVGYLGATVVAGLL